MRRHPARPARVIAMVITTALAMLLFALPGRADTYRCGSSLVKDGDPASDLLAKCGEPTQVSKRLVLRPPLVWRYGRLIRVPGGDIETTVETWLYDFGSSRLMMQAEVENGFVTKLETLGYGNR
jgi:hypothetical protein